MHWNKALKRRILGCYSTGRGALSVWPAPKHVRHSLYRHKGFEPLSACKVRHCLLHAVSHALDLDSVLPQLFIVWKTSYDSL